MGSRLSGFEAHAGVTSGIGHEWGLLGGRVDAVVVHELRKGEEFVPVVLSFVDEDSEEQLHFLVDSFRLTVGRGLICVGGGSFMPSKRYSSRVNLATN